MHETSVACQLVDLVRQQIQGQRGRVATVRVQVGVWSGIAAEALAAAYPAAAQGLLPGSKLVIESSQLVVWCDCCQAERNIIDSQRLRCPDCGARAARIVRGTELELLSVEIQDGSENNHDAANS